MIQFYSLKRSNADDSNCLVVSLDIISHLLAFRRRPSCAPASLMMFTSCAMIEDLPAKVMSSINPRRSSASSLFSSGWMDGTTEFQGSQMIFLLRPFRITNYMVHIL